MSALPTSSSPSLDTLDGRTSSPGPDFLSSPESSAASVGFIDMSDLMLPASALESELFGVPQDGQDANQDSNATVVSTTSCDELPTAVVRTSGSAVAATAAARSGKGKKRKASAAAAERRHSLPTTLLLDELAHSTDVTQPVPEFLCHLFSMLRDPAHAALISWSVPAADEPDHLGGGVRGQGKVVVHQPAALQDCVLGNYYRHSKYASFQRQLNYFGFKKRLHGGKKGKLSPCSYIHDRLTADAGSLFRLKRRPPCRKRTPEAEERGDSDKDCLPSVSCHGHTHTSAATPNKKCRVTGEKKLNKNKLNRSKKDTKEKRCGGKQRATVPVPKPSRTDQDGSPSTQSSAAIASKLFRMQTSAAARKATASSSVMQPPITPSQYTVIIQPPITPSQSNAAIRPPITPSQSTVPSPASPLTLLDLLSTSLPPSEILFNDAVDVNSMDAEGVPAWLTDDGQYHYHNVDSSLVDLAMLY